MYPFKHTEVFKREIQPHEMVKYLCERVAVQICLEKFNSKFVICLTQSAARIFN